MTAWEHLGWANADGIEVEGREEDWPTSTAWTGGTMEFTAQFWHFDREVWAILLGLTRRQARRWWGGPTPMAAGLVTWPTRRRRHRR